MANPVWRLRSYHGYFSRLWLSWQLASFSRCLYSTAYAQLTPTNTRSVVSCIANNSHGNQWEDKTKCSQLHKHGEFQHIYCNKDQQSPLCSQNLCGPSLSALRFMTFPNIRLTRLNSLTRSVPSSLNCFNSGLIGHSALSLLLPTEV